MKPQRRLVLTLLAWAVALFPGAASALDRVTIERWTAPQSGWLYVVDPRSGEEQSEARVWVVDPQSASVVGENVGVGPYDGSGRYNELRVFDTSTWQRVSTISTRTSFSSLVTNRDGSVIYATTRDGGSVLAIEPAQGRELREMPVGRSPSLVIVAP